ncbi:hypothetical protein FACS1894106_1430 [Spirochaetia bacterium]|nr:hypothetical protein FACS1894106_1430 [Spirochaetia bacterium]
MKILLQEVLTTLESKVRNSLARLSGVQVGFNKIEKSGGFYVAIFTVCVPLINENEGKDEEKEER